jgi:hypothetical protein
VSRIELEKLAWRPARVEGIHDKQAFWTGGTQAERKEEAAHTSPGIPDADIVGYAIVGLYVLHQRAPETVVPKQKVAAAQNKRGLLAKLREIRLDICRHPLPPSS